MAGKQRVQGLTTRSPVRNSKSCIAFLKKMLRAFSPIKGSPALPARGTYSATDSTRPSRKRVTIRIPD